MIIFFLQPQSGTGHQSAWGWDFKFSMPLLNVAENVAFKWEGNGDGLVLELENFALKIQPLWSYNDPKDVSFSLELRTENDDEKRDSKLQRAMDEIKSENNSLTLRFPLPFFSSTPSWRQFEFAT